MANKITTAVAVEGEQEYRSAIKNCSNELKTLKSDLAATESEFRHNADSMEALTAKGQVLSEMYETQQERVQKAAEALQNALSAQEKYGAEVARLQQEVSGAQEALQALTDAGQENSEEATALRENIERLNAELSTQQQYYDAASKGADSWTKELNYSTVQLHNMADQIAENNQKIDDFRQGSEGAAEAIGDVGDSARESTFGADLFANSIQNIAATFTAAGIVALLKSAAEAVYEFAIEIQDAQAIIVKGTGAIGTALDDLTDSMMNVYAAVDNGNLSDIATAVADVNTRLKLSGEELEEVSRLMVEFSDVTGLDVSASVENVSKIMKNWNVDIADTERLMDKLVAASQASGLGVAELSSTILRYRATFMELGYSLDESIAVLANMEDAGLNASQVMMGLQTAVRNLAKDGGDVGEALKSAIAEIESLGDTSEATAKAVEVFGSRAGVELAEAIKSGRIAIEDWIEVLDASEGIMQRTADGADTFEDRMQQALNGVKAAAYSAGEALGNDLGKAFEEMTAAANSTAFREVATELEVVQRTSEATARHAGELAQKMADLGRTGLTTAEAQAEYASIVEQLNALIPGLNLSIDQHTGIVTQNTAAILENIAAWEQSVEVQAAGAYRDAALEDYGAKLAELQANREKLTEAEVTAAELSGRMTALYKTLAEEIGVTEESAESFYGILNQAAAEDPEIAALAAEFYEVREAAEKAQETVDVYAEAVAASAEATEAAKAALDEAEASFAAAEEASRNAAGAETEQAAAVAALQEAYYTYTGNIQTELAELNAALAENEAAYAAAHEAAVQSIEGQFKLMEQLPDVMAQSEKEIEESLNNLSLALETQTKYWTDYADNIRIAMERGVSEGLVKTLADGSEEGARMLANLAQATDEEIAEINSSYEALKDAQIEAAEAYVDATTTLDEANEEIKEKMEELVEELDVAEEAYDAGILTIMGYKDGALSKEGEVVSTFKSIADAAVSAFETTVQAGVSTAIANAQATVNAAVASMNAQAAAAANQATTTVTTNIYTTTLSESQVDYVVDQVDKKIGGKVTG